MNYLGYVKELTLKIVVGSVLGGKSAVIVSIVNLIHNYLQFLGIVEYTHSLSDLIQTPEELQF